MLTQFIKSSRNPCTRKTMALVMAVTQTIRTTKILITTTVTRVTIPTKVEVTVEMTKNLETRRKSQSQSEVSFGGT